jgi:hypothetical protein
MNYVYGSECQMGFSIGQFDRTLWAINNWVPTLIDTISNVISVPEDYTTIQEALDSADVGYSIHVSPGIYFENIQWPNIDELKLIGAGPDSTIIDGNQNGRVIKVGDDASPPLEISGFTITNGSTNGRGGGMQIKMTGDILLSDLIISNNQANTGGGIIVEGIGGAWNGEAHVIVENVIFSGNHATGNGGGYSVYDDYVSTLFKSITFANNSAGGSGGGMHIYGMSHYAVLANSILWNNFPDDVSGIVFSYYSNLNGGIGGVGNFTADPLFMDSTDFHLQQESPCIDAGSALVIINLDSLMLPGEDWMGDTIINVNPSYYGGNSPDMGTYESPFTGLLALNGIGLPDVFALHANYPNPFNPVTIIGYTLSEEATINITVYDITGKIVNNLVNNYKSSGYNSIQWNATNDKGAPVSAGLYLYTIQAGEFRQTRKMVLLK